MGYPLDFREDEFVANTIGTFGRVLYWVVMAGISPDSWCALVIDFEYIP